ncbi:VPS20 [Candida oxycetoniae]|uniref:VPS20 n=1 Tax=Candida oxycetoniae TaxID=497107 RepID=A0AAI9SY40_9ASCO|nr:VPS20 [Candida oxycetoniae]KAI3404716.2 VPS20 [Candida oxycetoniae]
MGNQPSAPKITAQDRAIFQLKQQRDKIKLHQRKLSLLCNKQTELARKAILKKQPERAKFYLRLKRQQESTITKTFDQLDTLEKLIGSIEYKLIEKDVLYGLQQGNAVLKQLNGEMNVEKIDKILDDLEEEKLKEEEISQTLGLDSGLSRVDEEAIDEEFEKLNMEENKVETKRNISKVTKLPSVPKEQIQILPDVPTNAIKDKSSEKERQQSVEYEPEPIAI